MRLVILLVGLLLALPRSATAGPGTTAVKKANETISALLARTSAPGSAEEKALATKVTTSVRAFLDIDELGKRAMASHWSTLTKEQQARFTTVLRELIEASYVRGLRANLTYSVEYASEATDASGNTVVLTKVKTQRKGKPLVIEVEYVLVSSGGSLKAWDVRTDGVGLVENYRVMFDKIMKREKFEGLIKRMQDKKAKS